MSNEELRIAINSNIIDYLDKSKNELMDIHYDDYVNNIVTHTINSMIDSMLSKQFGTIIHQLEIQRRSRNKFKKAIKKKENNRYLLLIYNLGKYDGVYSTMSEMIEKTVDQNQLDELYNQLKSKKYLIDIIVYLNNNPLVHHKNICDAIGIKPNYLSELMANLNEYGIINKYSFSKYTNYSLTEKGKRIYELNKKFVKIYDYKKIRTLKENETEYMPTLMDFTVVDRENSSNVYGAYSSKKYDDFNLYLIKA